MDYVYAPLLIQIRNHLILQWNVQVVHLDHYKIPLLHRHLLKVDINEAISGINHSKINAPVQSLITTQTGSSSRDLNDSINSIFSTSPLIPLLSDGNPSVANIIATRLPSAVKLGNILCNMSLISLTRFDNGVIPAGSISHIMFFANSKSLSIMSTPLSAILSSVIPAVGLSNLNTVGV